MIRSFLWMQGNCNWLGMDSRFKSTNYVGWFTVAWGLMWQLQNCAWKLFFSVFHPRFQPPTTGQRFKGVRVLIYPRRSVLIVSSSYKNIPSYKRLWIHQERLLMLLDVHGRNQHRSTMNSLLCEAIRTLRFQWPFLANSLSSSHRYPGAQNIHWSYCLAMLLFQFVSMQTKSVILNIFLCEPTTPQTHPQKKTHQVLAVQSSESHLPTRIVVPGAEPKLEGGGHGWSSKNDHEKNQ